jgi:predicted HicB family RNase H-like nuclease
MLAVTPTLEAKDKAVLLRLRPSLHARLGHAADRYGLSVSEIIHRLLDNGLDMLAEQEAPAESNPFR